MRTNLESSDNRTHGHFRPLSAAVRTASPREKLLCFPRISNPNYQWIEVDWEREGRAVQAGYRTPRRTARPPTGSRCSAGVSFQARFHTACRSALRRGCRTCTTRTSLTTQSPRRTYRPKARNHSDIRPRRRFADLGTHPVRRQRSQERQNELGHSSAVQLQTNFKRQTSEQGNRRDQRRSRIRGEHILCSTDAFFGTEEWAKLGPNSSHGREVLQL